MFASCTVVIPVYKSQAILPELIQRLSQVLPGLCDCYEVILVCDGSPDQAWDVICQLADEYHWIRGIMLMRNVGQHNALLCGIRAAQYENIVTIDDDLQHPPEEIYKLLSKLEEGYDVVYGTPMREQHGLWRDASSRLTKFALQSVIGAETAREVSAYRAFKSHLVHAFDSYRGTYVSIDVLLTWGTHRFTAVRVQHNPRKSGDSNYTFRKLVTHALNLMTGFSTLPLRFASLIGFFFTFFGLGILAIVIGRYLFQGDSVPGFPFLASIIAIFSGAQLFSIGIIGEYLARMHFRLMDKPPYTILDSTKDYGSQ